MADRGLKVLALAIHLYLAVLLLGTCVSEASRVASNLQVERAAPKVWGMARPMWGKTVCQSPVPLPYLWPERSPTVGEPYRVLLTTTACTVPDEPDWPMWLACSFREPGPELPLDLTATGMPGCWLHIHPDILVPVPPVEEGDEQGGLVRRSHGRGRATFTITVPETHAGLKLWLQVVVLTPTKFVTSHALEVTFGTP